MRKKTFTLLLIFFVAVAWGQEKRPPAESGYPAVDSREIPHPPPAPVRTMAEWEEVQAIVIPWFPVYQNILTEIVRHSVKECQAIILTFDVEQVKFILEQNNIPLANVHILPATYNSIWIRDYGPWTIYHRDVDSLMIVDWEYDRPFRTLDDAIPSLLADRLGLPIYQAIAPPNDWIHAGGNNLQDGMGTLFSSELVFETNPGKTEMQIDQLARDYLGAERYYKLPTLPYDSIHHLDMHMRFIDEETIIIGEYPPGVADGPQIEANIAQIREEARTAFGNSYEIIRIPMPPDAEGRYPDEGGDYRTYTNSIFVNKTLLVPTYEERYDTTALRIYREALPGYKVVGIDCNAIIDEFGAIHCISKLVGAADPLWIAHSRLRDTENTTAGYPVEATIKHRSGIAGATLFYRVLPEEGYTAVPMSPENPGAGLWKATIPGQPGNSEIQYYIHAEAFSGKEQLRPMVAPEGYFRFRVLRPNGIPAPDASWSIALFPNPIRAGENANIRVSLPRAGTLSIRLANELGQELLHRREQLPAGSSELQLPTGHLPAGHYQAIATYHGQYLTQSITVAR